MGLGEGGDSAIDVTYSTKPDNPNIGLGLTTMATTSALTTTTINIATTGSVMWFVAGGDNAIDVTYSTKPDNPNIGVGVSTTTGLINTTTKTNTDTTDSVMGFDGGGDDAIDDGYSTKPNNQNIAVVNTQYEAQNIEMYN